MLQLKEVKLTYFSENGETEAIKNVSFSVKEGDFVAILGPSGCGKSTILSLISGLLKPTHGEIIIQKNDKEKNLNNTGYMFQKDYLFEWRSVLKNVQLGIEITKKQLKKDIFLKEKEKQKVLNKTTKFGLLQAFKNWHKAKKIANDKYGAEVKREYAYASELLKKYGLWEFRSKYPNQLSGGMRQRVALIRTLTLNPDILLLDEPFSSLDYQTRLNLCDDVSNIIKNENKTTILVTHDITEALSMANKIIVLTARPAQVKSVYEIDNEENLTPLQRRESGKFLGMFDTIWKELQHEEAI